MSRHDQYSIVCDDEDNLQLSNYHEAEVWDSLEKLLLILVRDNQFTAMRTLFAWKETRGYRANAKEAYSWRSAIEEIKNSDLMKKGEGLKRSELLLIADKPAMLKMAGETANALLHSYTRRHAITFRSAHSASNVPS